MDNENRNRVKGNGNLAKTTFFRLFETVVSFLPRSSVRKVDKTDHYMANSKAAMACARADFPDAEDMFAKIALVIDESSRAASPMTRNERAGQSSAETPSGSLYSRLSRDFITSVQVLLHGFDRVDARADRLDDAGAHG